MAQLPAEQAEVLGQPQPKKNAVGTHEFLTGRRFWPEVPLYCRIGGRIAIAGGMAMLYRSLLAAVALAWVPTAGAQIFDYGKYPDLRGQWVRYGPSGPDLKGPLVRLGPSGVFRTR